MAKNEGNGKSAIQTTTQAKDFDIDKAGRFFDISFQIYDDGSNNSSLNSRSANSKESLKSAMAMVRSKMRKGLKLPILQSAASLEESLNSGYTIHFGITHATCEARDVEFFSAGYMDYDGRKEDENKVKVPIPNAANLEQLLSLPIIQQYCIFYQESYSFDPNYHFFVAYDRDVTPEENKRILSILRDIANNELAEGIHKGFDNALAGNSTNLCYAGKSDCKYLDRGEDGFVYGGLIPVDEWLNDPKKQPVIPTKKVKKSKKSKSEKSSSNPPTGINGDKSQKEETPLQYLERVIGKDIFKGNFALWFDRHPNYPGDSWVMNRRSDTHIEGRNPFSSTDSSPTGSFFAKKDEDSLPPTWGAGGDDFGHVVEYHYRIGRTFDGKYLRGGASANFRKIIDDLCDKYKVERYPWNNAGEEDNRSRVQKLHDSLIGVYPSESFRLNEMNYQIELDGEEINPDTFRAEIDLYHNIRCSDHDLQQVVLLLANKNKYHPIREDLERVKNLYPEYNEELKLALSSISTTYLGTTNKLYDVYLKKHLIAGIARLFQPGCMVKTMVVLQGGQNYKKSTFIEKIAGKKYFSDNLNPTDAKNKDTKASINKFWMHEIGEIDQYFRKSDRSAAKAFISSISDDFRLPYARRVQSHPRMSILWGTCNDSDILDDPTGSVRFWCITVPQKIDTDAFERGRDKILAAAYHAYLEGGQWWLTDEEEKLREDANEQFTKSDPWEDIIIPNINSYDAVTIEYIYPLLDIEIKDQNKSNQNRIIDILKKYKWTKGSKKFLYGKSRNPWINPNPSEADKDLRFWINRGMGMCKSIEFNQSNQSSE